MYEMFKCIQLSQGKDRIFYLSSNSALGLLSVNTGALPPATALQLRKWVTEKP